MKIVTCWLTVHNIKKLTPTNWPKRRVEQFGFHIYMFRKNAKEKPKNKYQMAICSKSNIRSERRLRRTTPQFTVGKWLGCPVSSPRTPYRMAYFYYTGENNRITPIYPCCTWPHIKLSLYSISHTHEALGVVLVKLAEHIARWAYSDQKRLP